MPASYWTPSRESCGRWAGSGQDRTGEAAIPSKAKVRWGLFYHPVSRISKNLYISPLTPMSRNFSGSRFRDFRRFQILNLKWKNIPELSDSVCSTRSPSYSSWALWWVCPGVSSILYVGWPGSFSRASPGPPQNQYWSPWMWTRGCLGSLPILL